MNFWYLLKNKVLLEKLSSASLPPSMNMPNDLGRCAMDEKYRNLDYGLIYVSLIEYNCH